MITVNFQITAPISTGGGVRSVVDCGGYNASGGTYPAAGGTGTSGAIKRGNQFDVTTPSVADGNGDIKFPLGAVLRALVDAPGQVDANWKIYVG